MVEREKRTWRQVGTTVHAVGSGWVRAHWDDGARHWIADNPIDPHKPLIGVSAHGGLHRLVEQGLRVFLTAEEACGTELVLCDRCAALTSSEGIDLFCELRADAGVLERMRLHQTRPIEEALADVRKRHLLPSLLSVASAGLVSLESVGTDHITDDVVWAAWQMGLRAPGGRGRLDTMPMV